MRNLDCAANTLNTTPRTPRPLLGVLLASAVVLSARTARADDTPRIFPLVATSPLSAELAGTPDALTDALADLLGGVTTERSLEEFAGKLRCDPEMSTCLDAVARSLVTNQLVYGTLAAAPDGKIKVKLVRFDSATSGSEMHQRTFTLTARTPKRLGKQLARSAAQMFDRQPPEDEVRAAPREQPDPGPNETIDTTSPEDDPADPPPSRRGEPARGGITASTWGLIGGGALGAAVGAGFLVSARGLRAVLDRAPRETTADFRRLTAIERAGRIRMQVGSTLLVAGGAGLAAGAVRAILQSGRKTESESLERSIALVPVEGGAAVVLSGGLR